ncbi:hypothetical protein OC846_001711 [Tilletia horrida]|uniref:Uncharacterized protein n=1 Tax=Tilletia horrida TaxID=155126 RepID=A0AAN6GUV1_9BASI|nr:hypothetical protein OC846_001711 [Tilletia horrida]KAK0567404.1 hypothetical protein OC861_002726 [Tilletia horrida]
MSNSQTDTLGLDDELNSFTEEFLKINFKKQRAEAAKFSSELKANVGRVEKEAVAIISQANKDVSAALPPAHTTEEDIDQIAATVEHVLDNVLSDLQASLEQYQADYDRTLVEGQNGRVGSEGAASPSHERLHAIDAALHERPKQLISHSRKLIKKHDAELQKRAERKEIGAAARAMIRQLNIEHKT